MLGQAVSDRSLGGAASHAEVIEGKLFNQGLKEEEELGGARPINNEISR